MAAPRSSGSSRSIRRHRRDAHDRRRGVGGVHEPALRRRRLADPHVQRGGDGVLHQPSGAVPARGAALLRRIAALVEQGRSRTQLDEALAAEHPQWKKYIATMRAGALGRLSDLGLARAHPARAHRRLRADAARRGGRAPARRRGGCGVSTVAEPTLSKDQLILAMLAGLGGDRREINERDLFLACWHAFPNAMRWTDTALPNPDTFTASLRRLDADGIIERIGKQERSRRKSRRRQASTSAVRSREGADRRGRACEGGLTRPTWSAFADCFRRPTHTGPFPILCCSRVNQGAPRREPPR